MSFSSQENEVSIFKNDHIQPTDCNKAVFFDKEEKCYCILANAITYEDKSYLSYPPEYSVEYSNNHEFIYLKNPSKSQDEINKFIIEITAKTLLEINSRKWIKKLNTKEKSPLEILTGVKYRTQDGSGIIDIMIVRKNGKSKSDYRCFFVSELTVITNYLSESSYTNVLIQFYNLIINKTLTRVEWTMSNGEKINLNWNNHISFKLGIAHEDVQLKKMNLDIRKMLKMIAPHKKIQNAAISIWRKSLLQERKGEIRKCNFFQAGNCKKGNACDFAHDISEITPTRNVKIK